MLFFPKRKSKLSSQQSSHYSIKAQVTTILFVLTLLLIPFICSTVAFAAGYLDDSTIQGMTGIDKPHGGYADTTNKCKACHAVHLAEGSYRLLRADNVTTECDYCHKTGTGIISAISRVDGTTAEGHTMGYSGSALDDSDPAWNTAAFGCKDCHSPHDSNTVILSDKTTSKLLKADPDPGEAKYWTGSGYESEWCSDCHSANYGVLTEPKTVGGETRYGHDCYVGLDGHSGEYECINCHVGFGANPGKECSFCHQSSGYPHSQSGATSRDLLKNDFDGTNLDDVCNDCHKTENLP